MEFNCETESHHMMKRDYNPGLKKVPIIILFTHMLSLFLSHVCPVKVNVNLQLEGKHLKKTKIKTGCGNNSTCQNRVLFPKRFPVSKLATTLSR